MNIKNVNKEDLYKYIGPPLLESFQVFHDFDKEEAETALKYFRSYYKTSGLFECEIYTGIEETLKELKANNKTLLLATSKPEAFARRILDYYDLSKYFLFIGGSTLNETRTTKFEVIDYVLSSCGLKASKNMVMIGDRMHDIHGGKSHGLDTIAVLYGYGNQAEFEKAGADYIVEDVQALRDLLKKER